MSVSISSDLNEKDFEFFLKLHEFNISTIYPFSSKLTAKSIVATHLSGNDPNGYFTKKKTIWKLVNERRQILGFSVVTEKRGGSIKFGPSIVAKDQRHQGLGTELKLLLEAHYKKMGFRKAYLTTNAQNINAYSYLLKIGYRIEAHLQKHYTENDDELVFGKELMGATSANITKCNADYECLFGSAVKEYFSKYYSEIDASFFGNIKKTLCSDFDKNELSFVNKSKICFEGDGFFTVTAPKRGGCVKMSPLIFSKDEACNTHQFAKVVSFYGQNHHKLYTLVPVERHHDHLTLKSLGFVIEGILRAPYAMGQDLLVYSYFIRGCVK